MPAHKTNSQIMAEGYGQGLFVDLKKNLQKEIKENFLFPLSTRIYDKNGENPVFVTGETGIEIHKEGKKIFPEKLFDFVSPEMGNEYLISRGYEPWVNLPEVEEWSSVPLEAMMIYAAQRGLRRIMLPDNGWFCFLDDESHTIIWCPLDANGDFQVWGWQELSDNYPHDQGQFEACVNACFS